MLNTKSSTILEKSREIGWVLEPDAKQLLALNEMDVTQHYWAKSKSEAVKAGKQIGFPVVAKVISPDIVHKSEYDGVAVGIANEDELRHVFDRFSQLNGFQGLLVEETVAGLELIIGGKIDYQFGPVILLGIGGTGVEIYQDTAIRMAPLRQTDIESMIACLKGKPLIRGFRGAQGVNIKLLTELMVAFSNLIMQLEHKIESIDLNPVMCSPQRCCVADARIILAL